MGLNILGSISNGSPANGGGSSQINSLNQGLTTAGSMSIHAQGTHTISSGSPSMQIQQPVFGLGPQLPAMDGLGTPVKLEQHQINPQAQSMASLKLEQQADLSILQSVKLEQIDDSLRQHQQRGQTLQGMLPLKLDSSLLEQQLHHGHNKQLGVVSQQQPAGMDGLTTSLKVEQQQINQHMQPLQALAPVKLEQQVDTLSRQGLTSVKLEPYDSSLRHQLQHQRIQALQGMVPLKLDARQQEATLQRQQSQHLQAQMNFLHQQRYLHQHRTQLQQQQQLLQQMAGGPLKQPTFEPGICARRLMQYMYHQRQRPQDNNIHFWRRFVGEFFAQRAKKRWCVSQYGNSGRQPTGVFPQDVWHCEICGSRPGRGFETTVEVLPRLCKIKYDSGILDELLYVDIPNEYRLNSGLMVLEYGKAIQESIFDHLRVVRDGQLRIIFSTDLKILNWEFCARGHEELLPRRLLVPQVTQLAAITQKYQNSVNQSQNGVSNLSVQDLQTNCQLFVGAARQLARTLEAPTVNDLGYTKRYVRCLQISEVVNSMKDLIDFSRENRVGPLDSLINFPRRTASFGGSSSQEMQQLNVHHREASNAHVTSNGVANDLPQQIHAMQHHALTSSQNVMQSKAAGLFAAGINSFSSPYGSDPSPPLQYSPTTLFQNCHLSSGAGQPSPNMAALSQAPQRSSLSSAMTSLQRSDLQGREQKTSSAMHHLVQEMILSKSRASFQQNYVGSEGVLGNMTPAGAGIQMKGANGVGVPANVSGGSDSNGLLIGNATCNGNLESSGGISSSLSNGMVGSYHSTSENGSNVKSIGSNVSVGNADGVMVGDRHNLSGLSHQEQNFSLDDPSLLNELTSNEDILSGFGNSSFSSLPFSW